MALWIQPTIPSPLTYRKSSRRRRSREGHAGSSPVKSTSPDGSEATCLRPVGIHSSGQFHAQGLGTLGKSTKVEVGFFVRPSKEKPSQSKWK